MVDEYIGNGNGCWFPDEYLLAGVTLERVGIDLVHLQDPCALQVQVFHILHKCPIVRAILE